MCASGSAEATRQYEILLNYIEKENFQIAGFSREVTLIDNGITSDTLHSGQEQGIRLRPIEERVIDFMQPFL